MSFIFTIKSSDFNCVVCRHEQYASWTFISIKRAIELDWWYAYISLHDI